MSDQRDRHELKPVMIRLPATYRPILKKIHKRTGRPMSWAVQIAVEHHARSLGLDFRPNWPEAL